MSVAGRNAAAHQPSLGRQARAPSTSTALRVRAARAMVDLARMAQGDGTAAGLTHLTPWQPVDPGGGHGACGNPAGRAPGSEAMPVPGQGAPGLARLGLAIGGPTPHGASPLQRCRQQAEG